MALCLIVYTLLGFQILREANTATYSIFLMSSGMLLPGKGLLLIVCLSAALSGSAYLLQLICAKTKPASVLYPLGSIVMTASAGRICFREKQDKAVWISIALCVVGAVFFL